VTLLLTTTGGWQDDGGVEVIEFKGFGRGWRGAVRGFDGEVVVVVEVSGGVKLDEPTSSLNSDSVSGSDNCFTGDDRGGEVGGESSGKGRKRDIRAHNLSRQSGGIVEMKSQGNQGRKWAYWWDPDVNQECADGE